MKNRIEVVGAAIVKDGRILALRRSDGIDQVKHKFEFAGGKVEKGETHYQALMRECMEELSLEIEVGDFLNKIEYEYPDLSVCLSIYFVKPLSGFELKVHEEARWMDYTALDAAEWAPADRTFLNSLKSGFIKFRKAQNSDVSVIREIANSVIADPQKSVNIIENVCFAENVFIVNFNGEDAGFFAYSPSSDYDRDLTDGTYVTHMYLKQFARHKKIMTKFLANLPRPVYIEILSENITGVNILKHVGFRILKTVKGSSADGINDNGFLMVLN